MNIQTSMMVMQAVLTFGNLCIMLYAFSNFLRKPHDSLTERIVALEVKQKEVENALRKGNDKFREQDATNEVLIRSTMALIEFEIQFCLTEKKPISADLDEAKQKLHDYLAKK